jgi:membrane-bound lytic murein transglycosylase A
VPRLADIPGWAVEDAAAALTAYRQTRDLWPEAPIPDADTDPRRFFEAAFVVSDPGPAHLTAYYEPELPAALTRTARFAHPLHGLPEGWSDAAWQTGVPYAPRAEILARGDLPVLAWVETAVEAFLAQVQGSVRLMLAEGGRIRLGYGARNGHDYVSIGKALVAAGQVPADKISAEAIRAWCAAAPDGGAAFLNTNPSYVFFRRLDLPEESGPLGAMGRPVIAGRSLAVDPAFIPLGAPVWVEAPGLPGRLMVAQDTGSAIKGAARGDIFLGTGEAAGKLAGALSGRGRMLILLPAPPLRPALPPAAPPKDMP